MVLIFIRNVVDEVELFDCNPFCGTLSNGLVGYHSFIPFASQNSIASFDRIEKYMTLNFKNV